jgi:hypothetical protein
MLQIQMFFFFCKTIYNIKILPDPTKWTVCTPIFGHDQDEEANMIFSFQSCQPMVIAARWVMQHMAIVLVKFRCLDLAKFEVNQFLNRLS